MLRPPVAVISVLLLCLPSAFSQDMPPDGLVRGVTAEVIASVKQDADIKAGNTKKAVALVEQKVLPHFDFRRMTALAMGAHWRKATLEEQNAIIDEFRLLLVHTYSSALSSYRDQVIETRPLRGTPAATDVVVRSTIKQAGSEPVTIDYSMQRVGSDWKIYDITVVGVSLVLTYRDTFATELRNGGFDGLIKTLARKNRELSVANG